ncbi:DUF1365 domain-containing protein [Pseudidiomarina mangrovi]|uniref:DUF1365 domain-containing protein n=1 Tax=Pseudidiomarina mangrovi TaxID=2487133 RepID=UPI0032AEA2AF
MLSSAIMRGEVSHKRFTPTQHSFRYATAQWWLALDELPQVAAMSRWWSVKRWAPLQFRRSDYLRGSDGDLTTAVCSKMSELAGQSLHGRVFFLGNVRTFGLYFSPINCYFLQPSGSNTYSHMLAEVSNTPWNERHYYLLDLSQPLAHDKAFHVSPFNPLDMQYQWRIRPPAASSGGQPASIHLEAHKGTKHFAATVTLARVELNSKSINRVLLRFPVNTVTTVLAIYWQALKLWLKRTPIYDHQNQNNSGTKDSL